MGKSKKGKRKSKNKSGGANKKKKAPTPKAEAAEAAAAPDDDDADGADGDDDGDDAPAEPVTKKAKDKAKAKAKAKKPEPEPEEEEEEDDDDDDDEKVEEEPLGGWTGSVVRALTPIDEALGKIELVMVSVFVLLMILVAVYQFFITVVLSGKVDWADEVLRYSVFFTAMSAAALAAQQRRMMAVDIVPRLLRPRTRAISRVVIALFVVGMCYLLYKAGMMNRVSEAQKTEHYHYISAPNGILALPIGAALIGFHFLFQAVVDFLYLISGRVAPEPEMAVH